MYLSFSKLSFITTVFLIFTVHTIFSQTKTKIKIDSLFNLSKTQNQSEKTDTFLKIAEIYYGINKDSSLYFSEKANNLAEAIGDKKLITNSLLQIGSIRSRNSEYKKGKEIFNRTLKYSKELGDSTLLGGSIIGLANIDSRLGNLSSSVKKFIEAAYIYEAKKDTINIAKTYLNLALDLKKLKEYEKSVFYSLKSLNLFEKINESLYVAMINNNLSGIYNETKRYKKSLKSAKKAEKFFLDNGYKRYIAYPLTNISISYDSLKQYTKAEKSYRKAIEIHTKYRNPYELAFLNNALANLKYKQKDYQQSLRISKNALVFAEEVNALEFKTSSTKTVSKSYQKLNDFKNSNKYLNRHLILKDSLFQIEKTKDIAEIQTKYETSKKEKEIAQQKETLLNQKLELKNKTLYTTLLTGTLLILAIIFIAVYKRNQLKRTQLQKEIELKDALAIIKTQNRLQEQRLRISRDLHDNIGSQLTFIISSLDNLKFVSKDVNDKLKNKLTNISSFTSETISQLRDTIWAMNKNEISIEDLHTRILSFVEKAKTAVNNTHFEVNYTIDKNTSVSSLVGMNIFRVIQEAINNAIKYADAMMVLGFLLPRLNLETAYLIWKKE